MKHPKLSTLQDYFENELNEVQSGLVKGHLLDCDECTMMLSQMAKVDTCLKKTAKSVVSDALKSRIFSDAKVLLEAKRKKIEVAENYSKATEEWFQSMGALVQNAISELKVPVFQLASLSILIGYIVTVNQVEKVIEKKPLSEEVVVYTHGEHDSSVEGDSK